MITTVYWFLLVSFLIHRFQNECRIRWDIGENHHVILPKGIRLFFRHLGKRKKYLTAAVLLQCIAYIYFIGCICALRIYGYSQCHVYIERWGGVLTLCTAVFVCVVDTYYRIDARKNKK